MADVYALIGGGITFDGDPARLLVSCEFVMAAGGGPGIGGEKVSVEIPGEPSLWKTAVADAAVAAGTQLEHNVTHVVFQDCSVVMPS